MSETKKTSMSFLAHVGELRGHLVRSILALVVTSIAVAIYWDELVKNVIMAPLKSTFFYMYVHMYKRIEIN